MSRVVVAGENLVDRIVRADGTTVHAVGGGPFNTARTIARLGGDVAYLGRVSRDRDGRAIRAALEADGVDCSLVVGTDDPTTLAIAELGEDGSASYRFSVDGTAAAGLTPDDVGDAVGPTTRALHVGTLGLVLEPMAGALAGLVAEAPDGVLVMVDPNVRPSAIRDAARYRAVLAGILARADVVKISSEDARWLDPGREPADTAAALVAGGVRVVLLTAGGAAVVAVTRMRPIEVAVPRVSVVDTVGAGDAFGGGFLASWLDRGLGRADLDDDGAVIACVERAVRVAGLTCTRPGADPPWTAEVDAR